MNIDQYKLAHIGYKECLKTLEDKNLERVSLSNEDEMFGIEEFTKLKVVRFRAPVTKEFVFPELEILCLEYYEDVIEVFISLLEKQPKLKKLYITASVRHFVDNAVDPVKIFDKIQEFSSFFDKFPNLGNIVLIRNQGSFVEVVELSPSLDTLKSSITGYKNTGHSAKVKQHKFLKDLTTLRRLELPRSKDKAFLSNMLETNSNIEELHASWKELDEKWFLKEYKTFGIEDKHIKNYKKLQEDLVHIDDKEKDTLSKLFLVSFEPSFKPEIGTLFAFLNCSLSAVRKEALKCFDKYYSEEIVTIQDKNIWLSGALQTYKTTQAKEMLVEKNSKLSTKKVPASNLLVVGLKPKLEELPTDIAVISAIRFEEMLSQNEERVLAKSDNENISEKLKSLLLSEDESNVTVACTLMEEGGVPEDVRSYIMRLFLMSTKQKRARFKKIIERHGGELGEKFLSIMGRKSTIDKKMMKQIEVLDGLDMDVFMYLGHEQHYFTDKESPWARKMILNHFNKERTWIYTAPSKIFLEATNIKEFTLSGTNDTLWKMHGLTSIFLSRWNDSGLSKSDEIVIAKEAEGLKNLRKLEIGSKTIDIEASLAIEHLVINNCKNLIIADGVQFNALETIEFDSCSLDLIKNIMDILDKNRMPNLTKIVFDNGYGSLRTFSPKLKTIISNEFPKASIVLRRYQR